MGFGRKFSVKLVILFVLFKGMCCKNRKEFIVSPDIPQLGNYSHAVLVDGKTLYLAGQIGSDSNCTIVSGGIVAETRRTLENIGHVLKAAGATFGDVVKTTVFLQDINDARLFGPVYMEFFPTNYPARSTVQVAKLHLNASIEIEAIAEIDTSNSGTPLANHGSIYYVMVYVSVFLTVFVRY